MSDIEQALAEALRLADVEPGDDRSDLVPLYRAHAAAILATEPMQTIARQAAIGAAVERWTAQEQSVYLTPAYPYDSSGFRCVVFEQGADEDDDPLREGDGSTIPEAIAAALEAPYATRPAHWYEFDR